ncbi:MAG TPA: gamma-glutamyl-gamma-aminobutyrate hydrolase family protein [Candidatus Limnocylindria bacterium]|nr:gamma-glutamyl-gamma-aminobutyrate hydrolase family protein [Candidatus Limnocylindria bacterium]
MSRVRDEEDAGNSAWIVLRHSPLEGVGLLGTVLRDYGIHHRGLDLYRGEPAPKDTRSMGGLIVLGGAMGLHQVEQFPFLKTELQLVERTITAGRPVLGICLGAQMIAHALGARVFPGERREVGWGTVMLTAEAADDPVFGDSPSPLEVFHLHGDTYELPPDARHLARSDVYEQQAFEWGGVVYGLQFHLEFTESMIQRLTSDPEAARSLRESGVAPEKLLAEAAERTARIGEAAQRIFSNYFRQCGL